MEDESAIGDIVKLSFTKPVIVFKHSTRCAVSSMALNRLSNLTQDTQEKGVFYFLDLIKYRQISNKLADTFGVYHESPQLIIMHKGECVYDASHNEISKAELEEQLAMAG